MTDTDPAALTLTAAAGAQVIADTATRAADPAPLEEGKVYALTVPAGGSVEIIDRDLDEYRDWPRRKTGTVTLHDVDSFVTYLAKHALPETEVYADVAKARITAVINAHNGVHAGATGGTDEGRAGWSDHRAMLTLRHTPAWHAWATLDGKLTCQVTFAEHIEDRLTDIVDPPGAAMLELAQTFQAKTKVTFESSKRLTSGERQLEYREDTQASAGRKGDVTIPDTFTLGIAPFEGSREGYRITARLRYRIGEGTLSIGYRLDRPDDVLRAAFADTVADVAERITPPVLHGTPAAP
ncbi:MAG: DUF2303 family protein [Acidimicrobiia bacterium]